jgi:SAM-dependent methyltransferase
MKRLPIPPTFALPTMNPVVSDNDVMLHENDFTHYMEVGISALSVINAATSLAGIERVTSILDLPCGHGRVTRALQAAFPHAKIIVSDIDRDGVDFCAKTFAATPVSSSPDFSTLELKRTFDVIWVGSLMTHLPAAKAQQLVACIVRHLSENGVGVVTSHGAFVAGRVQVPWIAGQGGYSLDHAGTGNLLRDYFHFGYGFSPYPLAATSVPNNVQIEQQYGVSLTSREWLETVVRGAGGDVLFHRAHAWDNHHDVIAFRRARQ